MQILCSLSPKFFKLSPIELINITLKYPAIKGFEIAFHSDMGDTDPASEAEFVKNLAFLMKKHDLKLQLHALTNKDLTKQKEYLDIAEQLAKIMDDKIKIVFHPLLGESIDDSNKINNNYFAELLDYIKVNDYNLTITAENLTNGLDKNFLIPIISNFHNLGFTFDIGHEIYNYGLITDTDQILIDRLDNVHLHTFTTGFDHQKLYKKDKQKSDWVKSLLWLKKLKYKNSVVLEFDLNKMEGEILEERINDYFEVSNLVNDYIKSTTVY